jgi:hypothetical protein
MIAIFGDSRQYYYILAFFLKTNDHIERIFAFRSIVYLNDFEKMQMLPKFWGYFYISTALTIYILIMTKNRLGYILGDFATNSFGHPAASLLQLHMYVQSSSSVHGMLLWTV